MAWADELLPATLGGITADCLRTRDGGHNAYAEYAFPYKAGAEHEFLGADAVAIDIDWLFWGPDYLAALNRFRDMLAKGGAVELVHPVFGTRQVIVADWSIDHEADWRDAARVSTQLREDGTPAKIFSAVRATTKADAIGSAAGVAGLLNGSLLTDFLGGFGPVMADVRRIANLRNVAAALTNRLGGGIGGFVATASDILSLPSALANDWQSAVQLFNQAKHFGASVRWGDWQTTHRRLSAPVPKTVATTTEQASDNARLEVAADVVQAVGLADAAGSLLRAELVVPVLTPPQLEAITNQTRQVLDDRITQIEAAWPIVDARPIAESLRDLALSVQDAARAVLVARPPLVTHAVPGRCNLHLLAHWLYADYTRADELARLNPTLRNPNALDRGDQVSGYAE